MTHYKDKSTRPVKQSVDTQNDRPVKPTPPKTKPEWRRILIDKPQPKKAVSK
jgi:hypothetical protein